MPGRAERFGVGRGNSSSTMGGYAECCDRSNEFEPRGNAMLAMTDTSTETLLCELLATCVDTNHIASELAAQSRDESLAAIA